MQKNGWPELIKAVSGNGGHLLFKLQDFENNKKNIDIIKNTLVFLADKFNTKKVKVDQVTYNPARIAKFYGTRVRKGPKSKKRPHRFSRIDSMPETMKSISLKNFKEFISIHIDNPNQRIPSHASSNIQSKHFSVETFCQENSLVIKEIKKESERTLFILKQCIFNPDHRKKDACIIWQCPHHTCIPKGPDPFQIVPYYHLL
jgi:hypothetical protein